MTKETDKAAFCNALNQKWKDVFTDSCTGNWQDRWFLDGKVAAVINREDGMQLAAGPQFLNHDHHTVLWTKDEFEGDLKIEFDYTRADYAEECVNIIYIQATGAGQAPYLEDISQWNELRESPAMAMYHDYMNTYHISFAVGKGGQNSKDYVRARRYIPQLDNVGEGMGKGLANTDLEPDYFNTGLFAPGVLHHFCLIKKGQELFMKISNDEKTSYFHWNNTKAPAINHGRIGIRHMFTRSAIYKNFKISVPE